VAQEQDKFADVSREARRLMVEFEDSSYAIGAAFMLAKFHADKQDWVEAESHLNWVISHHEEAHWKSIAAVRLAKLMIAQDKHNEAIQVLDRHYAQMPEAFRGVADYLRGSALQQLGQEAQASVAFKKAQTNPQLAVSLRSLSQLWLDDLTQEMP
jgi:predicted negative regulator of RcsB-dependent stress response